MKGPRGQSTRRIVPSDEISIESIETRNELLSCRRGLAIQDLGIVVTHRIAGRGQSPVKFQIYDPLPSRFAVDEIGFHPDFEPREAQIDEDMAVASGVVEPDEELVFKYGLCPIQPLTPAEIEDIQQASRPSIEISGIVGPDEDVEEELNRATSTRSAQGTPTVRRDSPSILSRWARRLWGREAGAVAPPETERVEGGDSPRSEPAPSREQEAEPPGNTRTVDGEDPPGPPGSGTTTAEESIGAGAPDRLQEHGVDAERYWGWGGDPFGPTEINGELAIDLSREATEAGNSAHDMWDSTGTQAAERATRAAGADMDEQSAQPGESRAAGTRSDAMPSSAEGGDQGVPRGEAPFIESLVAQLEAGAITDDQRTRLATEIERVSASRADIRDRPSQRLAALEASIAGCQPLIEQLEAVLDEYGTGEALLQDLDEEVDSLSARMAAANERVAAAAEHRSEADAAIERLEEETAHLDTRLQEIRDRLESLGNVHRSKVGSLEHRVRELESTFDKGQGLDAELTRLRGSLEAHRRGYRRMRRLLSDEDETPT